MLAVLEHPDGVKLPLRLDGIEKMTDAAKRVAEFAKRYLVQRDRLRADLELAKMRGDSRRIGELAYDLEVCEKYIADNRLDRFRSTS